MKRSPSGEKVGFANEKVPNGKFVRADGLTLQTPIASLRSVRTWSAEVTPSQVTTTRLGSVGLTAMRGWSSEAPPMAELFVPTEMAEHVPVGPQLAPVVVATWVNVVPLRGIVKSSTSDSRSLASTGAPVVQSAVP